MLALTGEATTTIRRLTDESDYPETCGLRIAGDVPGTLRVSLAAVPAEDDAVLDETGARVFLDPQALTALDDKVLDAAPGTDGTVKFAIADRTD
jgi:Fe-S cluster assembly iron-binding protein IscA